MRHLYAPTPGEFLVGEQLERQGWAVYLPTKDIGIDLLAERQGHIIRIQVKESRTYPKQNQDIDWTSWCQLKEKDLSRAQGLGVDAFVFVVHAPDDSEGAHRLRFAPFYVVISPATLDAKLAKYRRTADRAVYWHRDHGGRLWEVRSLASAKAGAKFRDPRRDFTEHLNAWRALGR